MKPVVFFATIFLWLSNIQAQPFTTPKIETGVSHDLAIYRKQHIENIQYKLAFSIPENKSGNIDGTETILFDYKKSEKSSLQIDFKADTHAIQSILVNKHSVPSNIEKEHIVINNNLLKSGSNQIDIIFTAGNAALNRRENYLYTLFVPDRARTMFPCFDQPDLKAQFSLNLTIPKHWRAIANGKLLDSTIQKTQKTFRFTKSDLLPTYLFSFAAGIFNDYTISDVQLLYRETDTSKIKNSLDSIFKLYNNSIDYYEKWTEIPYPFQKHGMVAVSDFQFGGMEHPGAIVFQNASLFLDKNATQSQLNSRSNLVAHEVAHQWFGDMVTMNWFTDVWMKEVFANFMADKSTDAAADKTVYDLKFLTAHFPAAYSVDRTLGSNPIRQPLDNLQNAGMLYGSIIYDKAPIMMRQLELLMGEENFRKGVNDYLKKYAYKNASWPDLIACLNQYTKDDLPSWNNVWVDETGRPIIDYKFQYKDDKIESLTITQHPEYGTENKIWKQHFTIALYYPDTVLQQSIQLAKSQQEIRALKGKKKPLFILLNASGMGYGVFAVDSTISKYFSYIKNPVNRASAYIAVYENMLNNTTITPTHLLEFLSSQLENETTELNLRLIANYIAAIYWEFTSSGNRLQLSEKLEQTIWDALEKQTLPNNKKILLDCYQNIFQSQQAYTKLYNIWQLKNVPKNILLNDEDYTYLALALSLRNNDNQELLQQQLGRIKNPDRANRFKLIMKAASSNKATRDSFFYSLTKKENRTNESAISAALSILHHPLRQESAIQYLPETLNLLEDIQKTGDIFFPDNWLRSTFSLYQNPLAMKTVNDFINAHSTYNPVLINKILQATDNLRRAQTLAQ